MSRATPVEKIRAAIASQLCSFGAPAIESMHETMLIRNGLFCGRKFQCHGHEVVWFMEEDEIKFFSPCGDLLKSCTAISCIAEYEADYQTLRHADLVVAEQPEEFDADQVEQKADYDADQHHQRRAA